MISQTTQFNRKSALSVYKYHNFLFFLIFQLDFILLKSRASCWAAAKNNLLLEKDEMENHSECLMKVRESMTLWPVDEATAIEKEI